MVKKSNLIVVIILTIFLFTYFFGDKIYYNYIAYKNDITLSKIYHGPYYWIIEGVDDENNIQYVAKLRRQKPYYKFPQTLGLTKNEAIKIAEANGYIVVDDYQTLQISVRKSGKIQDMESIKKNLVWHFYYDLPNSLFIEIDFEDGKLFDFGI